MIKTYDSWVELANGKQVLRANHYVEEPRYRFQHVVKLWKIGQRMFGNLVWRVRYRIFE